MISRILTRMGIAWTVVIAILAVLTLIFAQVKDPTLIVFYFLPGVFCFILAWIFAPAAD